MNHLFTILNGGVFLWLVIGVFFKRRHPLHMLWMTFGFALDFALLLFIELDRKATGQLFAPMGPWLVVHIIIATILVPWYPVLIYSGGKVSAGKPKTFHKRIAMGFFLLRFLLWVTAVLAMQAKAAG
ncbi:MAG: hypothetical protein H6841_10180 [Planctomycetes bacterium]|nr:hypothetical protein [Planctomycetota bacterium]